MVKDHVAGSAIAEGGVAACLGLFACCSLDELLLTYEDKTLPRWNAIWNRPQF
jgi:hypothetical protein